MLILLKYFQETRDRVKRLLSVADKLVEKGHSHADSIQTWVSAVDQRYKDFSARMEKYRIRLETELGLTTDVCIPGRCFYCLLYVFWV